MSSCNPHNLELGKVLSRDGDFEFEISTVNGVGMFTIPSTIGDEEQYVKIVNDVIEFDTRDDDIILANYPKSGTHWVWEILNMLIQGTATYRTDVKEAMMLELMHEQRSLHEIPSPRILNTHLPYRWFPKKHIQNGGKIVHITRNPKDVYVSYFHHAKSSNELGTKTRGMTWDQYVDNYIFGPVQLYGTWFFFERDMAKGKEENKNVLTVHFEKLKLTPEAELRRLADFLDVRASDKLLQEITEKSCFRNLKKAQDDVKVLPQDLLTNFYRIAQIRPDIKVPSIYRKGEIGDWKNHFTVAQNERFDTWFNDEMKDIDLEVIFEEEKKASSTRLLEF